MRPSTAMRPPLCFYSLHYRISRADFRAPPRSSTRCSALTPRAFASGQARVSSLRMLRMSSALSLATLGASRKRVTCRSILHPLRRGIRPASGRLSLPRCAAPRLRKTLSSSMRCAPPSEFTSFGHPSAPATGSIRFFRVADCLPHGLPPAHALIFSRTRVTRTRMDPCSRCNIRFFSIFSKLFSKTS